MIKMDKQKHRVVNPQPVKYKSIGGKK